jgi:hypothetical protein
LSVRIDLVLDAPGALDVVEGHVDLARPVEDVRRPPGAEQRDDEHDAKSETRATAGR